MSASPPVEPCPGTRTRLHAVPEQDPTTAYAGRFPETQAQRCPTQTGKRGKRASFQSPGEGEQVGFTVTCPETADSTGHHGGEDRQRQGGSAGKGCGYLVTEWDLLNEGTSGSQGNNKDPRRSGSLSSRLLPLPGAARELGQLLTACLVGSGLPRPSKPLHAPVCRAEKGRAQPSPVSCPAQSGGDR